MRASDEGEMTLPFPCYNPDSAFNIYDCMLLLSKGQTCKLHKVILCTSYKENSDCIKNPDEPICTCIFLGRLDKEKTDSLIADKMHLQAKNKQNRVTESSSLYSH